MPDISGDGLADVLRIDHAASAFGVYRGGPDRVARLTVQTADWTVTGITDTYRVEAMDLTGDGLVNFADLARLRQLFFRAPGPAAPPHPPLP